MKNLQVKSNDKVEVVNVNIDSIVAGLSMRKQP